MYEMHKVKYFALRHCVHEFDAFCLDVKEANTDSPCDSAAVPTVYVLMRARDFTLHQNTGDVQSMTSRPIVSNFCFYDFTMRLSIVQYLTS